MYRPRYKSRPTPGLVPTSTRLFIPDGGALRALPDRSQPRPSDQRAARHHDPPVAPERPPRGLVGGPDPCLGGGDRATGDGRDVKVHHRLGEARLVECDEVVTAQSEDLALGLPETADRAQDELVGPLGEHCEPAALEAIEERMVEPSMSRRRQ